MIKNIENLINKKNYIRLKEELTKLNEIDIAETLENLSESDLITIFRLLSKDKAALVFSYLSIENEQIIINALTDKEAASIIDNMYADDATDLIDEMPANVVKRLLSITTKETRRDINFLLKYKDDSAGSIMTVEFTDVKENYTIKTAIDKIKKEANENENIDFCYVLDHTRKLLGTVSLKKLLLNDNNKLIGEIMDNISIQVSTDTDQEIVAQLFKKYDLNVMPVVDSENKLVGIITIDDIIDIIEEENTEDIEKMAAITPNDRPYNKTGVFQTFKKRIPWLLILMISATFTGKIIQSYESALASYVVLTSFIPMLMDTGGNAGSQASVTIIRSLSLNEINFKDIFKVILKEIRVALLVGLTLAIANFFKLLLIDRVSITIAFIVCLTLMITILCAKIVGSSLPMIAKRIGFDPAVMASPFITTIVDAISLIIYFQIATHLLGI